DYFVEEYINGRSQNHCIVFNKQIKFKAFLEKANEMGYDYIATGHYAQTSYCEKTGRFSLIQGESDKKDQSYVLFSLTQKQLAQTLFPIGSLTKDEVRKIATDNNLIVSQKPDSQDICFIPDGDYRSLLRQRVAESLIPGAIIDMEGKEVGRHQGLACYTIGQRRGLDLALGYPAYVTALDIATNSLRVGSKEDTYTDRVVVEQAVFQPFAVLTKKLTVKVKIRYKAKPVSATISPLSDGNILMHLKQPESAVTPGQAAVWYGEDQLIGGGIIKNAWRE
ncbi:MAG: tRNA 2-thiouridine(34) synthase MnmA, partial [Clostridiales bacterium]